MKASKRGQIHGHYISKLKITFKGFQKYIQHKSELRQGCLKILPATACLYHEQSVDHNKTSNPWKLSLFPLQIDVSSLVHIITIDFWSLSEVDDGYQNGTTEEYQQKSFTSWELSWAHIDWSLGLVTISLSMLGIVIWSSKLYTAVSSSSLKRNFEGLLKQTPVNPI